MSPTPNVESDPPMAERSTSIGRACTVEDEEPPETPSRSSIDSQVEYAPSEPRWSPALSLPVRDLIQRTINLTKQTCLVPYFCKVIPVEQSVQENKQNEQASCVSTGTPELISSPVEIDARLNRLSRLHRLCELVRKTIWLDSMAGVCNELSSSWINLSRQSDRITSKEYSNLDACNLSFLHIPKPVCQSSIRNATHYNATRSTCSGDSTTRTQGLPQSDPYSFRSSMSTYASQLGELRVLCESLRQSLTQTKRFGHEQYTMHEQWRNLAGGRFRDVNNTTLSPLRLLGFCTNELTSLTLLSAHHLVFSGLSLLAHSDLTRFTHGDLWEMMRGMEELDILSRHIQTNRRLAHSISLRLFLTRNRPQGTCSWNHLLETEVFSRAITPFPSVSVGYLFVILADQRSIRLSDTVFRQLCNICSHGQRTPTALEAGDGIPTQHRPPAEDEKSGRSHLVEAFRKYLHENYGRSASEYLRSEYEFISGFLDVLSQSTNLLYHVEKLKLVCSAAAAAQSKKAELSRDLQSMRAPYSPFGIPTSSHAMSVEGKHGILIRRGSGEKISAKQQQQQEQNFGSSSRAKERHKDVISYYQNTLHRACTLDRYVATGSTVCPLSEDTAEINEKTSHSRLTEGSSDTEDAQKKAEEQSTDCQRNTKKSVQWSDHREISTRHQVIGRFLEMMWQYSEQRLNTMFLIPPEYQITSIQSCGMSDVPATLEPQSNWKLSSCLCLPTSKLHNFASKVQEVAKSGREVTDRKVRGSNPTSATRLPLSRLGRPGSIPALLLPPSCMAARHRKGVIAERNNRVN
ncbi:hypothetical protein T265_15284, partial [Opisthorchis viverrini]